MTKQTNNRITTGVMLYYIIAMLFVALITFSCESKSGHRASIPQEKVAIISDTTFTTTLNGEMTTLTIYRVKRLNIGVIATIRATGFKEFMPGDTILYKFY
jgi:CRISPR/Cas system CMR subunit Cmr4 (Cas7 group RAMP superfamily)